MRDSALSAFRWCFVSWAVPVWHISMSSIVRIYLNSFVISFHIFPLSLLKFYKHKSLSQKNCGWITNRDEQKQWEKKIMPIIVIGHPTDQRDWEIKYFSCAWISNNSFKVHHYHDSKPSTVEWTVDFVLYHVGWKQKCIEQRICRKCSQKNM